MIDPHDQEIGPQGWNPPPPQELEIGEKLLQKYNETHYFVFFTVFLYNAFKVILKIKSLLFEKREEKLHVDSEETESS